MKIDMSPEAVTQRLRQSSELRKLCLSLGRSKIIKNLSQKKLEITEWKTESTEDYFELSQDVSSINEKNSQDLNK